MLRSGHIVSFQNNVFFIGAPALRQDGTGFFATEPAAQQMAIAAHPLISFFRDPNHSWQPKEESHGNQQRQAPPDKSEAARPARNPPIGSYPGNSFKHSITGQVRAADRRF